jgi:PAS domain-containing protein
VVEIKPVTDSATGRAGRETLLVAAFATAYTLAVLLGRAALLPDTGVGIVWPAAGVSVLWITARARGRSLIIDYALMVASTSVIVFATGGSLLTSLLSGPAAAIQAAVCCLILAWRCPGVWRSRGSRPLVRAEMWWFFIAALAGPVVSAPLVGVSTAVAGNGSPWEVMLLWFARNMVSIVLLGSLGFVLGGMLRRRVPKDEDAPTRSVRSRPIEWAAILVISPLLHALWFLLSRETAVVFPLIALACWAGVRLPSALVTVHSALVALVVVVVTAIGRGPFLGIGHITTEVAVAQLYVGLVCAIGLALALDRDERDKLSRALGRSRDHAQAQADLYGTIVATMGEGLRVVDRDGHVIVRNPAATRLLLGAEAPLPEEDCGDPDAAPDLQGIRNLDGSPLPPEDVPFRRSLAGHDVHDVELLVRPGGSTNAADERIVSFTTARLPATAGSGVVTVLRDVTLERQELHRAAQVQAGLLPTDVPLLPGYGLAAKFVPAGSVGGDFYDWYALEDGVMITVADVMGKGPGAAILAATTRSLLRAHGGDEDVVRPIVETEHSMSRDLENSSAFVTLFRASLRASTGTLTYSDAGHGLAAIVTAAGAVRRLDTNGLPLGVDPDQPRETRTEHLEPGDLLIVVSDGVLDALGGSMADLDALWRRCAKATADGAVAGAVHLVSADPLEDDVTVLALARLPHANAQAG